ncbi:type I polyketide synthase, partial [Nocardia sp. NPDC088792]|uniref:type I polyketide synthase n=1 Tax=Nocardia sp. NPDC088792 TaxID=3364332 RepID=UPI0038095952
ALMDPMLEEFGRVLETLEYSEPTIAVVSNVTGSPADIASPEYWVRQVRSTVRFGDGLQFLAGQGVSTFVEAGPDAVLAGLVEGNGVTATSVALQHGGRGFLHALARLFVAGVSVEWGRLFVGLTPGRVELPTYAFQHERYWPEPAAVAVPSQDLVDAQFWETVEEGDVRELARSWGVEDDVVSDVVPGILRWREERRRETEVQQWGYSDSWVTVDELPAESQSVIAVVQPGGIDLWTRAVIEALNPVQLVEFTAGQSLPDVAGAVVSLLPGEDLVTTVDLVRAARESGAGTRLWVITRGAVVALPGDPISRPGSSVVWGLGRVAALEHPGLWGGLMDLPDNLDDLALGRLQRLLTADHGEDQLAIRSSGVFARRLVRRPLGGGYEAWRTSGTALITGGTGGLGAHVARWVIERGAEHVVLLSRRGLAAPGAGSLRAELEAAGATVNVVACDVADRAALSDVLATIPTNHPLRTVVHTAGVLHAPTPIESLSVESLHQSLRAKLTGAMLLDDLTADVPLDAFVLFSSGAASWGGTGQGGYAAANTSLDALAHHRRSRGRVATSIAWGTWAEVGMAANDIEHRDYLTRLGVRPMLPRPGILALQLVLEQDETAVTVADIEWSRFAPAFTLTRPSRLFDQIAEAVPAVEERGTSAAMEFAALSPEQRRGRLTEIVFGHAAAVLGHVSGQDIDLSRSFRDAGFDSITAVEFRDHLQASTGLMLEATLVFDYPSPLRLIDHLDVQLSGSTDPDEEIRQRLLAVPLDRLREAGLLDVILTLAENSSAGFPESGAAESVTDLLVADVDDLVRIALGNAEDR